MKKNTGTKMAALKRLGHTMAGKFTKSFMRMATLRRLYLVKINYLNHILKMATRSLELF